MTMIMMIDDVDVAGDDAEGGVRGRGAGSPSRVDLHRDRLGYPKPLPSSTIFNHNYRCTNNLQ